MQTVTDSPGSVFVDHYAALGLDLSATSTQIKRSFRSLAKSLHPDIAGGDGLQFLELYSAYRVLSNNTTRNLYNAQYLAHQRPSPQPIAVNRITIMPGRLVFPGNVAVMARRGLLRRRFGRLHRRWMWNVNYDVELPLLREELRGQLLVKLPVVARTLCPDCRGSNIDCPACNGRGSYKNTRTIELRLDGGLVDGQIIEIPLERLRLESLSYFKKKKLRLKITEATLAMPTRASVHSAC